MRIAFADCVLDLDARRLLRDGREVHLPPKVYGLLEILIERYPRVVPSVELDELLWPKTFVGRSSLGRVVAELRTALGDRAREAKIIRTVHAVGYAFCAPLAPGGAAAGRGPIAITLHWGQRRIPIEEGAHIVGRDEACRVVIDAAGVSRQHARITVHADLAIIDDLGSKNGTYVNRQRISSPTPLRDADEIALGTALVTVRTVAKAGTTRTLLP